MGKNRNKSKNAKKELLKVTMVRDDPFSTKKGKKKQNVLVKKKIAEGMKSGEFIPLKSVKKDDTFKRENEKEGNTKKISGGQSVANQKGKGTNNQWNNKDNVSKKSNTPNLNSKAFQNKGGKLNPMAKNLNGSAASPKKPSNQLTNNKGKTNDLFQKRDQKKGTNLANQKKAVVTSGKGNNQMKKRETEESDNEVDSDASEVDSEDLDKLLSSMGSVDSAENTSDDESEDDIDSDEEEESDDEGVSSSFIEDECEEGKETSDEEDSNDDLEIQKNGNLSDEERNSEDQDDSEDEDASSEYEKLANSSNEKKKLAALLKKLKGQKNQSKDESDEDESDDEDELEGEDDDDDEESEDDDEDLSTGDEDDDEVELDSEEVKKKIDALIEKAKGKKGLNESSEDESAESDDLESYDEDLDSGNDDDDEDVTMGSDDEADIDNDVTQGSDDSEDDDDDVSMGSFDEDDSDDDEGEDADDDDDSDGEEAPQLVSNKEAKRMAEKKIEATPAKKMKAIEMKNDPVMPLKGKSSKLKAEAKDGGNVANKLKTEVVGKGEAGKKETGKKVEDKKNEAKMATGKKIEGTKTVDVAELPKKESGDKIKSNYKDPTEYYAVMLKVPSEIKEGDIRAKLAQNVDNSSIVLVEIRAKSKKLEKRKLNNWFIFTKDKNTLDKILEYQYTFGKNNFILQEGRSSKNDVNKNAPLAFAPRVDLSISKETMKNVIEEEVGQGKVVSMKEKSKSHDRNCRHLMIQFSDPESFEKAIIKGHFKVGDKTVHVREALECTAEVNIFRAVFSSIPSGTPDSKLKEAIESVVGANSVKSLYFAFSKKNFAFVIFFAEEQLKKALDEKTKFYIGSTKLDVRPHSALRPKKNKANTPNEGNIASKNKGNASDTSKNNKSKLQNDVKTKLSQNSKKTKAEINKVSSSVQNATESEGRKLGQNSPSKKPKQNDTGFKQQQRQNNTKNEEQKLQNNTNDGKPKQNNSAGISTEGMSKRQLKKLKSKERKMNVNVANSEPIENPKIKNVDDLVDDYLRKVSLNKEAKVMKSPQKPEEKAQSESKKKHEPGAFAFQPKSQKQNTSNSLEKKKPENKSQKNSNFGANSKPISSNNFQKNKKRTFAEMNKNNKRADKFSGKNNKKFKSNHS